MSMLLLMARTNLVGLLPASPLSVSRISVGRLIGG